MTNTDHSCHGAIFCGTPKDQARAECQACNPPSEHSDGCPRKGWAHDPALDRHCTCPLLKTHVVYAVHPETGAVSSVQLIATTPKAAISRVRGTLYHRDGDIDWLSGLFHVAATYIGIANNTTDLPEASDEAVAAWIAEQNEEASA